MSTPEETTTSRAALSLIDIIQASSRLLSLTNRTDFACGETSMLITVAGSLSRMANEIEEDVSC